MGCTRITSSLQSSISAHRQHPEAGRPLTCVAASCSGRPFLCECPGAVGQREQIRGWEGGVGGLVSGAARRGRMANWVLAYLRPGGGGCGGGHNRTSRKAGGHAGGFHCQTSYRRYGVVWRSRVW